MTETQAREEICRVGRSLFERGYVHATAGNISVRLDEAGGGRAGRISNRQMNGLTESFG